MKAALEERVMGLNKLRLYVAIESTNPEVSREMGGFLSEALIKPVEIRTGTMNIAVTFLWSLLSRVARQLEEAGEQVVDVEFADDKTVIVTKGGHVISIVTRVKHNQYVSEVEGIVNIDESPFRVEDY
jgi:hypothetical protein